MPIAKRTEAAERDLQDIAYHIAYIDNRPQVADKIIDDLIATCDKLAKFSADAEMGQAAPEIGTDVRLWPFKRWVILFRYVSHGVDILRFADGSQDYLAWKLSQENDNG